MINSMEPKDPNQDARAVLVDAYVQNLSGREDDPTKELERRNEILAQMKEDSLSPVLDTMKAIRNHSTLDFSNATNAQLLDVLSEEIKKPHDQQTPRLWLTMRLEVLRRMGHKY